jgi:hypothetical protein
MIRHAATPRLAARYTPGRFSVSVRSEDPHYESNMAGDLCLVIACCPASVDIRRVSNNDVNNDSCG